MSEILNIAATLRETAWRHPSQPAIVCPEGRDRFGRPVTAPITFAELDRESDSLAFGLSGLGVGKGRRIVLMVRPGVEFIALTFALFKTGAVVVLIDPGMGPRRVFRCLDHVEPDGFVALPVVQALRVLSGRRFSRARWNVTVGRRWFWGGKTYAGLLGEDRSRAGTQEHPGTGVPGSLAVSATKSTDPAAIIFT